MYYTVNRWVYFEGESPFVLTSFKKGGRLIFEVGLFLAKSTVYVQRDNKIEEACCTKFVHFLFCNSC